MLLDRKTDLIMDNLVRDSSIKDKIYSLLYLIRVYNAWLSIICYKRSFFFCLLLSYKLVDVILDGLDNLFCLIAILVFSSNMEFLVSLSIDRHY